MTPISAARNDVTTIPTGRDTNAIFDDEIEKTKNLHQSYSMKPSKLAGKRHASIPNVAKDVCDKAAGRSGNDEDDQRIGE